MDQAQQYYGVFDADGFSQGFWVSDIHGFKGDADSTVPAEAVEITTAQWVELVNHSNDRKWSNGEVVVADPPRPGPPPPAEPPEGTAPPRDGLAEIDELRARIEALEGRT